MDLNTWYDSLMSAKKKNDYKKLNMLVHLFQGSSHLFLYQRQLQSKRGEKSRPPNTALFVDRNNPFIVLFMATEAQSQGIKLHMKRLKGQISVFFSLCRSSPFHCFCWCLDMWLEIAGLCVVHTASTDLPDNPQSKCDTLVF